MGVDTAKIGSNSNAELKRRVDRRLEIFNEADELKMKLGEYKAEDKADGYTEKVLAQIVKEKRADADKLLSILTNEAEVDVARHAVGLPTDLETAQRLARDEAETVPEPKREARKSNVSKFPGGKKPN